MTRKKKVLVIEDDSWFAEQLLRTLENGGLKGRHASDSLAAIKDVDEDAPDVIVLDFFLPGPNALVLLHEIQSYADLSAIPVIICSSVASEIPRQKLASYGVVDILDKEKMKPDDILWAVRKALL